MRDVDRERFDKLADAQRRRFWSAFMVLFVVVFVGLVVNSTIVVTGQNTARETRDAQFRSLTAQNACWNKVLGAYVSKIGALADTNGRQLRGEPPDVDANRRAVDEMRAIGVIVANVESVCYVEHPDMTPLDWTAPR